MDTNNFKPTSRDLDGNSNSLGKAGLIISSLGMIACLLTLFHICSAGSEPPRHGLMGLLDFFISSIMVLLGGMVGLTLSIVGLALSLFGLSKEPNRSAKAGVLAAMIGPLGFALIIFLIGISG